MTTPRPGHLPLRVDWTMASPWVPSARGYHLDGIVAWAAVEREMPGADPALLTAEAHEHITNALPFSRFHAPDDDADRWVWMASLLQPVVAGSERRYLTSKTPSESIAELTVDGTLSRKGGSRVDKERGLYKASALHYPLEHARRISAWCVADPDALADLLGDIRHLGAKSRLGHGRILEVNDQLFQLTEDPAALDRWQWRQMPGPLDGYVRVDGVLRAPYWRRGEAAAVWRPAW